MAVNRSFGADVFVVGDARFENVEAHHVAHRIVEREREEIEIDHGMQALGEIVEEFVEVALLGDGFADFEQGFELAARVLVRFGRRNCGGGRSWGRGRGDRAGHRDGRGICRGSAGR